MQTDPWAWRGLGGGENELTPETACWNGRRSLGTLARVKSETCRGPDPSRTLEILSHNSLHCLSPPPRGGHSASSPEAQRRKSGCAGSQRRKAMASGVASTARGTTPHRCQQGCRLSKLPWCGSGGWTNSCRMEHRPLVSSQEAPSSAQLYWGCSLGESPSVGGLVRPAHSGHGRGSCGSARP